MHIPAVEGLEIFVKLTLLQQSDQEKTQPFGPGTPFNVIGFDLKIAVHSSFAMLDYYIPAISRGMEIDK